MVTIALSRQNQGCFQKHLDSEPSNDLEIHSLNSSEILCYHIIIQNFTNKTSQIFINGLLYCNLFLYQSVDTCGYLQVILEEHIIGGSWRGHTSVWLLGLLWGSTIPNIYIHVALNVAMFHLMIPNVCVNNPHNPYMEHLGIDAILSTSGHPSTFKSLRNESIVPST